MLPKSYIGGQEFRVYAIDWATATFLAIYVFVIAQHTVPFTRQFSLDDLTISHPFADMERVTAYECLVLITFLPATVILVVKLVLGTGNGSRWSPKFAHESQVTVLGLVMTLVVSGTIVDTLKNWIGRPRPDFLARCGPAEGTPLHKLVGIDVCTAPLGMPLLLDGMRSAPSGHSALSFACLGYLSLWMAGQLKLFQHRSFIEYSGLHRHFICVLPLVLATYVAFSRTQDYRHHFTDVFSGAGIGAAVALMIYHRYFPRLDSENPHKPLEVEAGPVLPQ